MFHDLSNRLFPQLLMERKSAQTLVISIGSILVFSSCLYFQSSWEPYLCSSGSRFTWKLCVGVPWHSLV